MNDFTERVVKAFCSDWDKHMTCGKCKIEFSFSCPCQENKKAYANMFVLTINELVEEIKGKLPSHPYNPQNPMVWGWEESQEAVRTLLDTYLTK